MGLTIGSLQVRRSILIEAPPARVWQEFESFERISAWLNLGHELHVFEPRVGGDVRMSVEIDGERRHYGGPVLIFDPECEVSFETIRLTPHYDATMIEIFHHGFERMGADGADNLQGYESGWDIRHLKALRAVVES